MNFCGVLAVLSILNKSKYGKATTEQMRRLETTELRSMTALGGYKKQSTKSLKLHPDTAQLVTYKRKERKEKQ